MTSPAEMERRKSTPSREPEASEIRRMRDRYGGGISIEVLAKMHQLPRHRIAELVDDIEPPNFRRLQGSHFPRGL